MESPTFLQVTPHLGSIKKISKLTIPTKLNFGEIVICLLPVPIWDEEIFVLISPEKLSIPVASLNRVWALPVVGDSKEGYLQRQRRRNRESRACKGGRNGSGQHSSARTLTRHGDRPFQRLHLLLLWQ